MSEEQLTAIQEAQAKGSEQPSTQPEAKPLSPEKKLNVFLAWATEDIAEQREMLAVMLEKAGMNVFPRKAMPETEAEFKKEVQQYIDQADCSVHILGGEFGKTLSDKPHVSYAKQQYDQAEIKSRTTKGDFRRFVWSYPLDGMILQGEQQEFIVQVQNNISSEVMFTTVSNTAQFIDDMRTFLEATQRIKKLPKEYDMAFISNVADAADCYQLIESLGEKYKLTTLTVVPDKEANYRDEASDMILRSKLSVVYFKESSDWAISFVKQLWKHVGGASTDTPFLLMGEDEPRRNRFLRFKAPETLLQVVKPDQVLPVLEQTYERFKKSGRLTEEEFSPYTGLRPFNEDESIFFKGRERHADFIIDMMEKQKFSMVTGASGDGKSSLVFAGVIPNIKGGFLRAKFSKWAVADFRPERAPLRNLANALAQELRMRNPDEVENALSYGFSALVDLYKKSPLYVDTLSPEYVDASEEERKEMRKKAGNLLILVDQFEEFFTNIENYKDGVASPIAQITVNVLVETVRIAREEDLPIYVCCTMRSDFIGQCVAFRGFAEMIGLSTYYVPRLKREEIQEVIEMPAKLNGNDISLRLTQRLLNDLGDGIDQLPVLSHALHQIWTYADKGNSVMDLYQYAQVGGLAPSKLPKEDQGKFQQWFQGLPEYKKDLYERPKMRNVLNRHANELYLTVHDYYNQRHKPPIDPEQARAVLKAAFVCLTKIDENRAVRNRMTLNEISDISGETELDYQTVGRIINLYREPGNTFVQPFITDDPDSRELAPNTTLDITHESLIRNWERLVDWAEEEDRSVRVYHEFKQQVNRWAENDYSQKFLLGRGPYANFSEWFERQRPNPAWIRRYLSPDEMEPEFEPIEQAGVMLEDMDEFLVESRNRLNRQRRLRNIALFVIAMLFIASIIGFINATIQAQEAQKQKEYAEEQAEEALLQKERAEQLATQARMEQLNAQLAQIDAKQAQIRAENQAAIARGEKLNAERQTELADLARQRAEVERQLAVEARKEAELAKTEADRQRAIAEEQAIIAREQSENARIQRDNAYLLQSLFLSSLSEDQTLDEDGTDGSDTPNPEVGMLLALEALPRTLGPEAERPYVAEAEAALYLAVNAIVNKEPKVEMFGHKNRMIFNQFSSDSKQLVSTSWDKTARLWDVNTGRVVAVLSGHTHIVDKAYVSEDNRYIVSVGEDFSARLWVFKTGRLTHNFRGHEDALTHAQISPDGQIVVTTSADQTARLWSTETGKQIAMLEGFGGSVLHADFSPTSRRVVTSAADGQVKLWNAQNGELLANLSGHGNAVRHVEFSKDGRLIVTASDDGTARIWNGLDGKIVHVLRGHTSGVLMATFSFDNQKVVTGSEDNTARVWEVATGAERGLLKGHSAAVYHVAFSSNNKHIVSTSDDRTIRLWDAEEYLRQAVFYGHTGRSYHAAFSPNSQLLAVAGQVNNNFSVRIYEILPTRQELIDLAYGMKDRELTEEEQQRFFLSDSRVKQETTAQEQRERNERLERMGREPDSAVPAGGMPNNEEPENNEAPQPVANIPATYKVQEGDTLYSIAKRYGLTVKRLEELNNIASSGLKVGQTLKLKP